MSTRHRVARAVPQPVPTGTAIVHDALEIRRLLSRAAEGHTAASLKLRETEMVLSTRLMAVDPQKHGIHLEFGKKENELSAEKLQTLTEETLSHECMVLIYLPGRSIVGFSAGPSELRKDRLVFEMPKKLFKIQRRKDVRFAIPQAYEFTVELDSQEQPRTRVTKRLIDISESGLSFFVLSPREAGIFKKGLALPRCIVRMQNQEFHVTLKVCNRGVHDRGAQGAGSKVGTEFEEISAADRNYIAQFVYSHAQHLFY